MCDHIVNEKIATPTHRIESQSMQGYTYHVREIRSARELTTDHLSVGAGHLCARPHAAYKIYECVLQHRRGPIDLNPDLLLFLRYKGKVRIYRI